jgi:hypothetical protein
MLCKPHGQQDDERVDLEPTANREWRRFQGVDQFRLLLRLCSID